MNTFKKVLVVGAGSFVLAACGGSDDRPPEVEVDTTAPTISVVDQQIMADTLANAIGISISDNRTETAQLAITITSSNQAVVSNDDLDLSVNGNEVMLTVSPQKDTIGNTMISVSASDEAQNTTQRTFQLDVLANQVSATEFFLELRSTGADQEPSFVNGIELIEDIQTDALFDDLFIN